jgi:hypothetical protein
MRPWHRESSSDLRANFRKPCVAEGAVIIIIIAIPPTLPDHCSVGENQPLRHQRDTADPISKRSAEYRRECYRTVGTLPARGMGQAKA